VILPHAVLEKLHAGTALSEVEQAMLRRVPEVVEQILSNIPRLEAIREILSYQDDRFDGYGAPAGRLSGGAIPWGARALKLIVDFDRLESEGVPRSVAFDTLRGRVGWYDPALVETMANALGSQPASEGRDLPLTSLRPGMVLAEDIRTRQGTLFVTRGQEVTPSLLQKLNNFAPGLAGTESIRVLL
jgi:HD-GYP domain-containing protein (c-di-GMP phosphodiesterase class II)